MANHTTTTIHSRQPGWGNEVSVVIESESDNGLQSGINAYFDAYPYQGYNTCVISEYETPTGHRAVVRRMASCD